MTQRELASLICKALAIYFFVNALVNLPTVFVFILEIGSISSHGVGPSPFLKLLQTLLTTLPPLLFLASSLFLWFKSEAIAALMVRNSETPLGPVGLGTDARRLVFSVLGLWTLLQVLPKVGQIFLRLFLFSRQDSYMRLETRGMEAPDIFALLIQLGLGLWLFFGSAGLAQMVRGVGRDSESS